MIFLVEEQHPWKFSDTDAGTGEPDGGLRIRNLRDELGLAKTVQFFNTPEDLASKVAAALHRWATSGRHSPALRMYLADCIAKEGELDRKFVFLSGTGERLVLPPTAYPVELVPRAFRVVRTRRQPEKEIEILPSIADVLERYPRVVILGDPGSGKSTILRYLHLVKAQQGLASGTIVPLYVNLAEWPESIPDLRSLLVHERDNKGCPSIPASNLLLLLDGLNEVRERDYVARVDSIQRWLDENPAARVVVAARQQQYLQNKQLRTATVTIHPLSDTQVETFVEKYLGAADARGLLASIGWDRRDKADRRNLARLAENPFQLALLCYVYAESGRNLPSTRGELLRILALTTYERERDLGTHGDMSYDQMQAGLGELALSAVQARSATAIDRAWASRSVPRGIDFEKLRDLGVNTRLLRLSKNNHYIQFSHQLILEYFAAERLSQQLSRLPSVMRKVRFQHGQRRTQAADEVFYTLAEIHGDVEACLAAIAEADPFLAIDALAESERADEVGHDQRIALARRLLDASRRHGDVARNAVIDRLQILGDAAVVALRELLGSGTKPERRLAIEALASIGGLDAIDQLIVALEDGDRWVRREAHDALLVISEHDRELAAEYVRERLIDDTQANAEARMLLVAPPRRDEVDDDDPALPELDERVIATERLPIAEHDLTPDSDDSEIGEDAPAVRHRRRAQRRRLGGRRAPATIRDAFPPPALTQDEYAFQQRLREMGRSEWGKDLVIEDLVRCGPAAVPQLIAAIENGNRLLRYRMPLVLAQIGDRRAVGPLVQLACDHDDHTAMAAAKALFTIFASALTPSFLASLLKSPNPTVQALALRMLTELTARPADTFEAVRAEVTRIFAVRQRDIPDSEIRRTFVSSNRQVRHAGLAVLLSIDAVRGIDACIAVLRTGNAQDREFALVKIRNLITELDLHPRALRQKTKTVVALRQFAVARARLIRRSADLDTIVRAILADPRLADRPVLRRECKHALHLLDTKLRRLRATSPQPPSATEQDGDAVGDQDSETRVTA
ncbi:MAG TPA: HEAT repeat domain-containing protein [Thermoanaerobaculia bacterium]|nr:HEAT repeat domain-containing protein [Thermoanaerobaculia bacterium]